MTAQSKLSLSLKRSRVLLLAGASAAAMIIAHPATAQTLSGLRGAVGASVAGVGGGASSGTSALIPGLTLTVTQAQQATSKSTVNLANAVAALKTQLNAQAVARTTAQAAASSVPNGLTNGGLVVDPRVTAGTDANLWVNASAPTQTTKDGETTVTIDQTAQRAILTWESFNVGKDTTVYFNQSAGTTKTGNNWVALNRIDATSTPSQILGAIKAEGTVLLINPNGIIFGGTAQVNVHSLIASSLDINSYSFQSANVGVFNSVGGYGAVTVNGVAQTTRDGASILAPVNEDNGDIAFLANGLFVNGVTGSGGGTLVLSTSRAAGSNVGVQVEAGAVISTAENVSGFDNGGYVALLGPQVTNAGEIKTAAGQISLAAASTIYLTEPINSSAATSFGVNNVYLATYGQSNPASLAFDALPVAGGALAVNAVGGVLLSTRGDITLMGDEVEQLGVAEATTSITRTGSINLYATGGATTANPNLGAVIFGSSSATSILPDENGETIPSDAASLATFTAPTITIKTNNLDLRSGALIEAPGAAMTVSSVQTGDPSGRVLLEDGSTIDLAGLTGVTRSVGDYLYTFKVTANDVADTPEAKSLIGQTVTINLALTGTRSDGETWVGSPLFAASGAGYLAGIKQSIDQLLTKGGSFSASGFADILSAKGSTINVSGGWIDFTGAKLATTKLIGSDGRIYDIGAANPFITYTGQAGTTTIDHARWGVTQTYTNPLVQNGYYQDGYVDGASAGSISVTAINPILEGALIGDTVVGAHQSQLAQTGTGTGGAQATPDQLPVGGALTINFAIANRYDNASTVELDTTAPDYLGAGVSLTSAINLGAGPYVLSTDALSEGSFGSITLKGAYELSMAKGASLSVQNGGSIILNDVAAIDGTLTARGGTISITGDAPKAGSGGPPTSAVIIGADALLDVSGLWVNDTGLDSTDARGQAYINGGKVSITTNAESRYVQISGQISSYVTSVTDETQSIVLEQGSVIDVSSGGYVGTNGQLKYGSDGLPLGKGGSVSLTTYSGAWTDPGGYNPTVGGYQTNQDPSTATYYQAYKPLTGETATVYLGGAIYAEGFDGGGTFSLQAPTITIGGGDATVTSYVSAATAGRLASVTGLAASSFTRSDALAGEIDLPTSFFKDNGFGAYALTSTYGAITVTADTTVTLRQSNYQVAGQTGTVLSGLSSLGAGAAGGGSVTGAAPWYDQASGAHVRDFASVALEPYGLRHAVNLNLTQSSFAVGSDTSASVNAMAGILIDSGASIVGEAGGGGTTSSISLTAGGSVTVLGDIVAPGGSIILSNNGAPLVTTTGLYYIWSPDGGTYATTYYDSGNSLAAQDIWIGSDAVLDVSGVLLPNPRVGAYSTGSALAGGSISLSTGGAIVALTGSRFDLAGTAGVVQELDTVNGAVGSRLVDVDVWSNGGSLSMLQAGSSFDPTNLYAHSLYFAGTVNAAGGAPQASGGTLNIGSTGRDPNTGGLTQSPFGDIVIQQSGDMAAAFETGAAPATQAQLSTLTSTTRNTAYITADTLNHSGLDSVSLTGPVAFSGSVSVKIPDALTINGNLILLPTGVTNPSYAATCAGAGCVPTIGATTVDLRAGFLALNGFGAGTPTLADGTLVLDASAQIDIGGNIGVFNASQVDITSGGDIRLFSGSLIVPNDVTLTARELYPVTNAAFLVQSTNAASGTITVASNGAKGYTPLSAGGTVVLDAETIAQDGDLFAPLGTIQLGVNASQTLSSVYGRSGVTTANLTLGAGGVTSVSADGLYIPDGTTISGASWIVAPPAKEVILAAGVIDTQTGALVDESGGGDIYATEFVAGTGGTRNLLATSNTYALVPSYEATVAAYDPNSSINPFAAAAGSAVTLTGGNGVAAGTYVLMPAIYATLPGAYRAVIVSTNAGATAISTTTADGSVYATGTLTNAITGAKSSQTALLEIQSGAVWTKYSEIDINYGDTYFAKLAAAAGTVKPRLASDGGQLEIAATSSVTLDGANDFAPATGGRGGEVDITGANILVAASDQAASFTSNSAYSNYLVLDADQISNLGVESVLIGGTRSASSTGTLITATALNLEIDTDAAHALTGPDLLLVTLAPTTANTADHGLTVDAGSVITAKGAVAASPADPLIFGANPVAQYNYLGTLTGYKAGVSGDGSLLRVSNGGLVSITRNYVPGLYTGPGPTPASSTALGALTVSSGVTLSGESLVFNSSGADTVAASDVLTAKNFDLYANLISIGGGSSGLVLTPTMMANFAGANAVSLHSASVFNLYGANAVGSASAPIGTLTFDGAGLYSDGGTTTIIAANVKFIDSQANANIAGANTTGSAGTLAVAASGAVTFGAGAKILAGFSQASFTAGSDVVFTGTGSLDAKAATVTLTAPAVIANDAAVQSLTTTGNLTLAAGAGTAPTLAATNLGGALSLTAASISDATRLEAPAGKLTLEATAGDLTLASTASLGAGGGEIVLPSLIEDTPGGVIKLVSDTGNVTIASGAVVDVSAAGSGYAGTLGVTAANGVVTLDGVLKGGAAYNDLGGSFTLVANQLAGALPLSGFTGSFKVELGQGDITIAGGQTLTSGTVALVSNSGAVDVQGTIDASGPSGGSIGLYGANGVTVGSAARLYARYQADAAADPAYAHGESTLVEKGGTITLGTTGTPDGALNATYGYENVTTSGAITVAAGAEFDVSGGPGGANIVNTGGSVVVRAPILTSNNVNVSFKGTVATNADSSGHASGGGVVLDAYAVWSTTDNQTDKTKYFDGIVDPAGWYDSGGNLTSGTFTDSSGNIVLNYTAGSMTAPQLKPYLQNGYYFTPSNPNAAHETFYGFVNGDATAATPGTLMGFVRNPFSGADAAVEADFSGAQVVVGSAEPSALPSSMLHLTPEIVLSNPSPTINGGNISILTNWNLGAGTADANGLLTLYYRDHGVAPTLTLRAVNNVDVKASLTDGFYQTQSTIGVVVKANTTDLNYDTALNYAINLIGNDDASSVNYGDLVVDVNVLQPSGPADYTVIGISETDYNQYYDQYGLYVQAYNYFYSDDLSFNSGYFCATSCNGASAAAAPTSVVSLLTAANALYSASDLTKYGAYLAAYNSYAQAYNVWAGSEYAIATTPVAPQLPPSISIPIVVIPPPVQVGTSNTPAPVASSTNQSPISGMDLASEASSTSYRLVAGAVASANPLAVNSAGAGDVTIDGHIAYLINNDYSYWTQGPLGEGLYRDVPTMIRTGVGDIDIAAAGDVATLDQAAPGVIYTAGTAAPNAVGFSAPSIAIPSTQTDVTKQYGVVSSPTWAMDGGDITITAGRDIIGIETPIDVDGSQTGTVGVPLGQYWSGWYYTDGWATGSSNAPFDPTVADPVCCAGIKGTQYASWINYSTFGQGVGALGGGNVTVSAGRNIYDLSVSLPETIQVSGGQSATGAAATAHYYGGGDLVVKAGGDLYSSAFYVGRGTGLVQVGGSVTVDPMNPVTGQRTHVALIYYSDNSSGYPEIQYTAWGQTYPLTYSDVPLQLAAQDGYITVQALGDVNLGAIVDPTSLPPDDARRNNAYLNAPSVGASFNSYGANAGVSLLSSGGNVTINDSLPNTLGSYGSVTGAPLPPTLVVEAVSGNLGINSDLNLYPAAAGELILTAGGDLTTNGLNSAGNPTTFTVTMLDGTSSGYSILGAPAPTTLSAALHANDTVPVILYAGQDIDGDFTVIKPADVYAGRDILNTTFIGQNNNADDITSIIAGRDNLAGLFKIYGPGDLLIEAGRDLGPLGIFSLGDGSNSGYVVPYLPIQGANIDVLFGVGNGIDYAAAITDYVDPAKAGTGGVDYLTDIANVLGEGRASAWATFQTLSPARQKLLVDRAFLDFLTQVSLDYYNPSSPYYAKYGRAYDTIATLFPASLGYTDNNTGQSNGAATTVHTGDLSMAHTLIETQTGGDINLIGPGGNIFVGVNSADNMKPSAEGILTLQGGSVRGYTDGGVEVYQSRIFTEQGGDIDLFSANGDLNAGKGVKSSAAYPPLTLICDSDGYCRVSPAGLVTGAGIGALISVPGQDPNDSNAVLTAPHGTVDAGAAGIRVAGNLTVLALHVANAFNIDVGGQSFGLPPKPSTNLVLATTDAATKEAVVAAQAVANNERRHADSVVTVEVVGFGGDPDNEVECISTADHACAPAHP